jgi:hypothetical protein
LSREHPQRTSDPEQPEATTARSSVPLPDGIDGDYEVYVNGVRQRPHVDFDVDGRLLVFERALRKDRISGWRWLLGAWGVGTYRQDDTVDVRYEVDGQPRVAHALTIRAGGEAED